MAQPLKSNLLSEPAGRLAGVLLATVVLGLSGCSSPAHQALIGTWKSAPERTLASMHQTAGIPAEVRARLADDHYGHLTIEYRRDTVRAFFDDSEYDSGYLPYEVVSVDADKIVTREWNEVFGIFQTSTTWLDGDCIYGLSAEYAFREYFCRLE